MKNAEQRAGCEIFCQKSWFSLYSLSKSTKTIPKLYNLFTVWFPKELVGHNFHGYCELEGAVQTQHGHWLGRPLSHKRPPRVAHSRRTCGAKVHRFLYGNVIMSY